MRGGDVMIEEDEKRLEDLVMGTSGFHVKTFIKIGGFSD